MSSILTLNSDILNCVFAEWIDVSNLTVLDSSICNSVLRTQFLHIVSQNTCKQKTVGFYKNNLYYLKWLSLRKLKVNDLSVEVIDENGINMNYSTLAREVVTELYSLHHLRVNRFSNLRDCVNALGGRIESITFCIGYDDRQDFDFNNESLSSLLPSLKSLKEMVLSNVTRINDEAFTSFSKYLPNLESFGSKFCDNISAAAVVDITRGCKKLRRLIVPDAVSDGLFLEILQNCPLLTHIEVSNCDGLNDSALLRLPEFCPQIVSFVAEARYQLQDITLVTLIKQYPKLKVLNVNESPNTTDALLVELSTHCPLLETLQVKGSRHITDKGVIAVASRCKLLKEVDFSDLPKLTDISVLTLSAHCPLLEKVDLSECEKVTDYALFQLIETCPFLTQLGQYGTNANGTAIRFAQGCNAVTFQDASGGGVCDGLVRTVKAGGRVDFTSYYCHLSAEVRETVVFVNRQWLVSLHITCEESDLSDDSVCRMIEMCVLLEDFKMVGCPLTTAAVVDFLTLHCPRVHSVEFDSLSMTDKHVLMLLSHKTHFRRLVLPNCGLITDSVFLQLPAFCPRIEVLNVSGCDAVTSHVIERIVAECVALHSITLSEGHISERVEELCLQKGVVLHTKEADEISSEDDEDDMFNHIELLEEGEENDDDDEDDGFGFDDEQDDDEEEDEGNDM